MFYATQGSQTANFDDVCCVRSSLRNKNIGDAGAQSLARDLQYYADIQKLK
jgi:hypothetical protein